MLDFCTQIVPETRFAVTASTAPFRRRFSIFSELFRVRLSRALRREHRWRIGFYRVKRASAISVAVGFAAESAQNSRSIRKPFLGGQSAEIYKTRVDDGFQSAFRAKLASEAVFRAFWGRFWCLLGLFGGPWATLGGAWGGTWVALGASCGGLGASWVPSLEPLGRSWPPPVDQRPECRRNQHSRISVFRDDENVRGMHRTL